MRRIKRKMGEMKKRKSRRGILKKMRSKMKRKILMFSIGIHLACSETPVFVVTVKAVYIHHKRT